MLEATIENKSTMANAEQFEAAALNLLGKAAEYAENHPSPDKPVEEQLAAALEAAEWPTALALIDDLGRAAANRGESHMVFVRLKRKIELLEGLGRIREAREIAREATRVARRDPEFTALVIMALDLEADLAIACGETREAYPLAEEALALAEKTGRSDLVRTRIWILLARCQIAHGDLDAAEAGLEAVFPLIDRMADGLILAGAQSSLARWHEATAGLHRARGELSQAVEHHGLAITRRRIVYETPHIARYISASALARSLRKLADLAEEIGDLSRAGTLLDESRHILKEARLPETSCPD